MRGRHADDQPAPRPAPRPEKIYRTFFDIDALPKWLPPNGFTCAVHHLDARVGGTYKMSFTNFSTGHAHSFGGDYLELAPNERIRHTARFDKKKVVQKKKKIGSTFKRYSGEASPFTLGPERFPSLQSNLLAALESDLRLLAVRFAK